MKVRKLHKKGRLNCVCSKIRFESELASLGFEQGLESDIRNKYSSKNKVFISKCNQHTNIILVPLLNLD